MQDTVPGAPYCNLVFNIESRQVREEEGLKCLYSLLHGRSRVEIDGVREELWVLISTQGKNKERMKGRGINHRRLDERINRVSKGEEVTNTSKRELNQQLEQG